MYVCEKRLKVLYTDIACYKPVSVYMAEDDL